MATGIRLSELLPSPGPNAFYDSAFKNELEYLIPEILAHPQVIILAVPNATAYQFANDFDGLLTEQGIPIQYHWIMMRCNGLTSPLEYKESMVTLIQPSFEQLDTLQQIWSSNNNKNNSYL